MKCPYCGETETRTLESRNYSIAGARNNSIRRRRECTMCLKRWTTYEILKEDWTRMQKLEDNVYRLMDHFRKKPHGKA